MKKELSFAMFGALLGGCTSSVPEVRFVERSAPEPEFIHDRYAEQVCAGLPRADEQICRLDRRLMEARRVGDTAAVDCLTQKGREMRASWRRAVSLEEIMDRPAGDEERERIRAAERSLERTFATLDDCVPSAFGKGSSVTSNVVTIGDEVTSIDRTKY